MNKLIKLNRYLCWQSLWMPLLIATLLLVACGGGGSSSSPPASRPSDDPILATFIPQEDGIRVEWVTPVELDDSITGILIVWQDSEGSSQQLQLDDPSLLTIGERHSWTIPLSRNTTYSFSISFIHSSGRSEQIASQELRTGPNYDEDEQIDVEDEDDDNDGKKDSLDDCQQGDKNWLSNHTSDYDDDGCRDDGEDRDDDNDGRADGMDSCSKGNLGWDSRNHQIDADQDGCRDEDEDRDLAGVVNITAIPMDRGVQLYWVNPPFALNQIQILINPSIGFEPIKPQQAVNVTDLQNGVSYEFSIIPIYAVSLAIGNSRSIHTHIGLNYDNDSLADSVDEDDDNDGVADRVDHCRFSRQQWLSNDTNDYDGDGCQDGVEDNDHDNDSLADRQDLCPFSPLDFDYPAQDIDLDGCRDYDEDKRLLGVENLRVVPESGQINLVWRNPSGLIDFINNISIQWSHGERQQQAAIGADNSTYLISGLEDHRNWTVNITVHYNNGAIGPHSPIQVLTGPNRDRDHLADAVDPDDDNDGVFDTMDDCRDGHISWTSNHRTDYDGDGCRDEGVANGSYGEDTDDDNDGLVDSRDSCRFSPISFNYTSSDDSDRDGCRDRDEDNYLASVSNLTAIPTKNSIHLSWVNPPTQLKRLDIEWNGTVNSGNKSEKDRINALQQGMLMLDGLDNQSNYTFVIVAFYTNGGISNQTSLIVRPGANYDMDGLADTVDTDKDNDGIANSVDTCPMGRLGWLSGPHNDPDRDGCHNDEDDDDDNDGQDDGVDSCQYSPLGFLAASADDIDGDGCRDRDEDISLPGVEGFEVIPERFGLGFELSWQNPSFPLSHINISYSVFSNTEWKRFSNTTNSAFIDTLLRHTPYTFSIIPYYANGGKGDAKTLEAQAGSDYDGDKIIDLLDDDDDNDGLEDMSDQCDFSPSGFRYASSQDINRNGCQDDHSEETDSFPGVTNLTAIPYKDSVDLNWINPNLPLAHLLVQWGDREQRLTADNSSLLVTQLESQHTWTFIIIPHYINGLDGQQKNITVTIGSNWDKDHIVDLLDDDDDNDGIPDKLDSCQFSALNFLDHPVPQDLNRDGCQDIFQRPNPFGISNLSAEIISSSAIVLRGNLDYSISVAAIYWEWQNNLDQADSHRGWLESTSSLDGNFSFVINGLTPETSYSFTTIPIYNNGGFGKGDIVDVDVDYDKDGLGNLKDDDDDNDSLPDDQDNCQFSPLGFHYLSDEDGDRDGCRDRDEDAVLAAVSRLNATVMDASIRLSWVNPNGSLARLTVDWTDGVDSSSAVIQDLLSLGSLAPANMLITGLTNYVNYTVSVTPEYISGISGNSSSVRLMVGPNHDNDSQIDRLDLDDDNDGIADKVDSCQYGRVNWQSSVINDYDGDGCRDRDEDRDDDNDGITDERDVDDDGDGLIEIDSAEALFNVRYQLDGSGYRPSASAPLNNRGCGAAQLTGISSCFGYELTQAISLANYPNWLPIAGDRDERQFGFQGSGFSAVFDGNHHPISDLVVRRPTNSHQALFGKLDGARVIRLDIQSAIIRGGDRTAALAGETINTSVSQVDISNSSISGGQLVGGLSGKSERTSLQTISSGHNDIISFYQTSGGLVGSGDQLLINSSGIMHNTIFSLGTSGGLVGNGNDIIIQSSAISHSKVFGHQPGTGGFVGKGSNIEIYQANGHHSLITNSDSSTGGLIGQGTDITVDSAHLRHMHMEGNDATGGFIGDADDAIIRSSSTIASLINGDDNIGGFIGEASRTIIRSSSNIANLINGNKNIGGFMGLVGNSILYDVSAINITIDGDDQIGGLIGQGRRSLILASYIQDSSVDGAQSVGGLAGKMEQWLNTSDPLHNQISYPNGTILASTMSNGMISGSELVGGLVGSSEQAIISTNHVNGVELKGNDNIGGLIGQSSQSTLHASYILNSHLDGSSCLDVLIGSSERDRIHASYGVVTLTNNITKNQCDTGSSVMDSYLDSDISGLSGNSSGQLAGLQSSRSLQQPTNYSDIYANWDQLIDLEPGQNSNVDAISVWCDSDHSGSIEDDERNPTNRIWHFGTQHDYPMGLCHAMSGASAGSQTPDSDNDTNIVTETVIPIDISIDELVTDIQQLSHDLHTSQRDPLIDFQWYLDKIDIKPVWQQGHTGAGVDVVLVDIGMEVFHEDLIQNVVIGASRNYNVGENDIRRTNPYSVSAHGTASAGTIAAKGDNGIGIKGLAPDAGIYAYTTGGRSASEHLSSLLPNTPQTAVSANVWGSLGTRFDIRRGVSYSLVKQVVEEQLAEGFYGRGLSYTIAAHNARGEGSASYMALRNHRGFMTVCAVGPNDTYAGYSNPGANLWICGPSSGSSSDRLPICNEPTEQWRCQISTTDNSGDAGWNYQPAEPARGGVIGYRDFIRNRQYVEFGGGDYFVRQLNGSLTYLPPIVGDRSYTQVYGGTSASTPIVSGAIAVLRAAYPHLTWRDIKLIVAESAQQLDKNNPSWQEGAVAYHNHSRKYHHSSDYGFGMINMSAAMSLAAQWRSLPTDSRLDSPLATGFLTTQTQSQISIASDQVPQQLDFIEHIDITIEADYEENFRNMDIVLTSPHGTQSILSRRYPCVEREGTEKCDRGLDWTFGSAAHLGENPVGDWTLSVNISEWDDSSRTWQAPQQDLTYEHIPLSWKMTFYGHNSRDMSSPGTSGGFRPPPGDEDLRP